MLPFKIGGRVKCNMVYKNFESSNSIILKKNFFETIAKKKRGNRKEPAVL